MDNKFIADSGFRTAENHRISQNIRTASILELSIDV